MSRRKKKPRPGSVRYAISDSGSLLLWWDGPGELDEEALFADIERNHGSGFASYLRAIWEHDKLFVEGPTAPARPVCKVISIESERDARKMGIVS